MEKNHSFIKHSCGINQRPIRPQTSILRNANNYLLLNHNSLKSVKIKCGYAIL